MKAIRNPKTLQFFIATKETIETDAGQAELIKWIKSVGGRESIVSPTHSGSGNSILRIYNNPSYPMRVLENDRIVQEANGEFNVIRQATFEKEFTVIP